MQIIGRSVVGALAMGNAVVLKPSEDACITALAFGEICREAGLPNGVINIVPGYGNEAGEYLSNHPGINHISFTGSVEVGSKIQQNASKNIVPVTLELEVNHLRFYLRMLILKKQFLLLKAGLQNAGQTCSASSRILVQDSIYSKVRIY